jgi:putative glutamine amidotransferase
MSRVEHPLIAVNGLLQASPGPAVRLDNRYAVAVQKAGGVPLVVPASAAPHDLDLLLERVDGLLLTGGDDFDTARLGLGPTHPAACITPPSKQDLDVLLAQKALERRMPVLGICYGMQLLGLVGGARLLQHLPDDRPGARVHSGDVEHSVRIRTSSKLARLLGVEELPVVSRHHQALNDVTPPWTVAAVDDEGLVEAIERPDLPFAVGVQWHPELAPEGSAHDRLFRGLVGAAGMAAAKDVLQRSRA